MQKKFKSQTDQLHASLLDAEQWHRQLAETVQCLKQAFTKRKKVLVAGNGGSATIAQHFADEMVGRYRMSRPPYPVIALTADSAVLTCIGNDFSFQDIFSRQVQALGEAGDVLLVFSTSGKSENLLRAVRQASQQNMLIVAFTGNKFPLEESVSCAVTVPSEDPPRIQELHLHAIHLICETFEPDSAK
ncbi:MAG: phosphoheptose isomerase [Planctomycetaceae bacterium]|nr:phosphoheptose isomerase [Planctomycetaceae bacterium]|tara:strand:- start:10950 stop:11513 length:564 start_codon:yes stop_codon:yes gene_type:complete